MQSSIPADIPVDIFNPYKSANGLNQGLKNICRFRSLTLFLYLSNAMILINCKLTFFSLHLFCLLFCNNYNIGELTSVILKEI